jgi:hypothetical protein
MPTENPYPAPAPLVLADMLAMHAWSDHIDDHSRKLLEWAADTIRTVVRKNSRLSHKAEQLEGDNALLFQLHYGPQKGGAS